MAGGDLLTRALEALGAFLDRELGPAATWPAPIQRERRPDDRTASAAPILPACPGLPAPEREVDHEWIRACARGARPARRPLRLPAGRPGRGAAEGARGGGERPGDQRLRARRAHQAGTLREPHRLARE